MKLKKNWRHVAKRSWSFRCHVGGAVSGAFAAGLSILPALQDRLSLGVFIAASVFLNVVGGALRLVDQGLEQ